MKAQDVKRHKEKLLALRARLRGDVDQMANAALDKSLIQADNDSPSMPIHPADIGSENFEREFALTLMASKDRTLEQIEEALECLEDGVYGVCAKCGTKIPKARLNAIPYSIRCVKCASRLEVEGRGQRCVTNVVGG